MGKNTVAIGTPFEKIAEDIFRTHYLVEQDILFLSVKHNQSILGASGHKHQIDVIAQFSKGKKEYLVLIECKFKTRSEDRVTLGEMRSFWGAMYDIQQRKGDSTIVEGMFLSNQNFNRGAIGFGQHYDIKMFQLMNTKKYPPGEFHQKGAFIGAWDEYIEFVYQENDSIQILKIEAAHINAINGRLIRALDERQNILATAYISSNFNDALKIFDYSEEQAGLFINSENVSGQLYSNNHEGVPLIQLKIGKRVVHDKFERKGKDMHLKNRILPESATHYVIQTVKILPDGLTYKEYLVLFYLIARKSEDEIATICNNKLTTIRRNSSSIRKKLGLSSINEFESYWNDNTLNQFKHLLNQ